QRHRAAREPFSVLLLDRTNVLRRRMSTIPMRTMTGDVAHALLRAAPRLVSAPGGRRYKGRDESRPGTLKRAPRHHTRLCALCFSAALLLADRTFAGEVLDRIAVVVGNTAITESEVVREARIAAFINAETPDLTHAGKRRAADRLVEQELIRREISLIHYADSGQADADQVLNQVRARYPAGGQFQRALQQSDITEEDLRSHLAWQAAVLRFTEFRFRGGNVDQQLDGWLKEARTRTPVEFREEVFR